MSRSVALRAGAAAVAVAALLVVVVFAAGRLPDAASTGRSRQIHPDELAAVMRQVLFVLYLAVLAQALYLWLTRQAGSGRSGARRPGLSLWGVVVFLLVLLGAFAFWVLWGDTSPLADDETGVTGFTTAPFLGEGGGAVLPDGAAGSTSPVPDWPVLVVGVSALMLVAAIAMRRASAPSGPELPPAPGGDAGGSSPLPAGAGPPDPRSRVLSAYLEVERAAWLRGRGRRPSETVPRHLHRLSPEDRQSTAPLASLYNRARFSAHRVSADDAARAERAGREIQRGLG